MQASIQLSDLTTNAWFLTISDLTSGQSFSRIFTYISSQLSAEWIVERPLVNGALSQLANFENATFLNCTATVGSMTGGITSFPAAKIVMYSSTAANGVQLTTVSDVSADQTSFTVTFISTTG